MISEENKAARASRIGSSDAPTIMGVNDYKQPLELWREKTGATDAPNLDNKLAIVMGNGLEDPIGKIWAELRGIEIYADTHSYISKSWDKAVSHIDFRISGDPLSIIEIKCRHPNLARFYGESGGDGGDIMPYDYVQIQHHCMVGGWDRAFLVVYLGGGDLRSFEVERDDSYIEDKLLPAERSFWAHVETGEPPELDLSHRTTADLLKSIHPDIDSGVIVDLGNHGESLHAELVANRAIENEAKKRRGAARLALIALAGDAEFATLPSGGGYRRKHVTRKARAVEASDLIDFRFLKKVPAG